MLPGDKSTPAIRFKRESHASTTTSVHAKQTFSEGARRQAVNQWEIDTFQLVSHVRPRRVLKVTKNSFAPFLVHAGGGEGKRVVLRLCPLPLLCLFISPTNFSSVAGSQSSPPARGRGCLAGNSPAAQNRANHCKTPLVIYPSMGDFYAAL